MIGELEGGNKDRGRRPSTEMSPAEGEDDDAAVECDSLSPIEVPRGVQESTFPLLQSSSSSLSRSYLIFGCPAVDDDDVREDDDDDVMKSG